MSTRIERIKSLIEEQHFTYQELENLTGIKKSSLQRYVTGATAKIPLDVIEKLAKVFEVSQEYLMGWSDDRKRSSSGQYIYSEGAEKLLDFYHSLTDETRKTFDDAIDSLGSFSEEKKQLALQMLHFALGNQ